MIKRKLAIAMVAPIFGDTGGPEIVTQNLTDALIKKGVDVTLFAPGDWKTKAKHITTLPESLWNMEDFSLQTEKVRRNILISSQLKVLFSKKHFDIIHLHSQTYAYCVGDNSTTPCVLSCHNKINAPEFDQVKDAGIYTVSLSKSQKGNFKTDATIWNGMIIDKKKFSAKHEGYLIAIGRLTDQKGIDTAIQIALKADKKLLIFGRIGNSVKRQLYYKEKIQPFLNKNIIHMGEVSHEKLLGYIRDAEALLFPIRRSEVCPLVIQEALASGTPVIGTKISPLPELLKDPAVSFLSDDMDKLVEAVKNTFIFDRNKCYDYAEKFFNSSRMADQYIQLYEKILLKKRID